MKKTAFITAITLILMGASLQNSFAQQTSYDLKKASNQYNVSGTVSIAKSGTAFNYTAVAKDLPATLPANGVYYIIWALTVDGKADNLGTITNSAESRGTLGGRITQFFITSEKERFPEYVTGPRIAQTDTIPESVFAGITSQSPTASPRSTITPRPRASSSVVVPVGGPTGAPETGLGGALLFNGLIYSLGALGFTGVGYSFYNKKKKSKKSSK